jgi:hypothetical protein
VWLLVRDGRARRWRVHVTSYVVNGYVYGLAVAVSHAQREVGFAVSVCQRRCASLRGSDPACVARACQVPSPGGAASAPRGALCIKSDTKQIAVRLTPQRLSRVRSIAPPMLCCSPLV